MRSSISRCSMGFLLVSAMLGGVQAQAERFAYAPLRIEIDPAANTGPDSWFIQVGDVVTLAVVTPKPGMPVLVRLHEPPEAEGDLPRTYDLLASDSDKNGSFSGHWSVPAWMEGASFDLEVLSYDLETKQILSSGRKHIKVGAVLAD